MYYSFSNSPDSAIFPEVLWTSLVDWTDDEAIFVLDIFMRNATHCISPHAIVVRLCVSVCVCACVCVCVCVGVYVSVISVLTFQLQFQL